MKMDRYREIPKPKKQTKMKYWECDTEHLNEQWPIEFAQNTFGEIRRMLTSSPFFALTLNEPETFQLN